MYKVSIFFFFILVLVDPAQASIKNNIIHKLKKIDNLSFNFKQTIGKKTEEGTCTISYPKKIFCEYNNQNRKIIVSNGKSLVIKNRNSGTVFIYPLKKTPLELILDKNFLIQSITKLEPRYIDNKYINFTILNRNNKINIFFDKKSFFLIGWQTEDIYQNLVITFINLIKVNQSINDNLFKLPDLN